MVESLGSTTWLKKSQEGSTSTEIRVTLDAGMEVRGEILSISRAGMHVRFPVQFPDGAVLSFRVQNCTAIGRVEYCRPDVDQFFIALTMSGDRRREPRLSANEQITLSVISAEKTGRIHGRLVDVSQSGIGLIIESPVAVGALAEVRADGGSVLYGEVRNCTACGDGFRVGILAEETLLWRSSRKASFLYQQDAPFPYLEPTERFYKPLGAAPTKLLKGASHDKPRISTGPGRKMSGFYS
jgi:hypothetical protein